MASRSIYSQKEILSIALHFRAEKAFKKNFRFTQEGAFNKIKNASLLTAQA
jgi:hypothetical protein